MRPVPVLHLLPEMAHGGTERVLLDLLARIDTDLFDITVGITGCEPVPEVRRAFAAAGLRTARLPIEPGAPVRSARRRLRARMRAVRRLRDYMRSTRPQIVHTHGALNNAVGSIAARLAGVPHIMTHDHDTISSSWRARALLRCAAHLSDIAFVPSRTFGEARRTFVRTGSERILQLPDGVDLQRFRPPTPLQRQEARHAFEIAPEAFVIGSIGRLLPRKRPELLLQALPHVLEQVPQAQLLLVGEGPERDAVLDLAHRLGIAAQVRLTGWRPELVPAYWALDVFALGAEGTGGSGRPLAEAMACGLPAVAGRDPVVQDLAGDHVALVVEPVPAALAQQLTHLARDSSERARLAAAARQHAVQHLDIEGSARLLETVYAHCVARTPRPWRSGGR